jgi:pilus assembly protein CpaE
MQQDGSLSVLITAKYEPTFDWVQLTLQEQHYRLVGRVDSIEQALKKLGRVHVDILLVDTSGEGVVNLQWLRTLSVQFPGLLTLVIATTAEMDFIREAMLAGAQGFLLKPFDLAELSRSIEQVHQLWLQRHARLTDGAEKSTKHRAHAVAVFSPKGGTGVTTLAVNLAIALKQQTTNPVLLVDADLNTPDVDVFLNVFSDHSILDLVELRQGVDLEMIDRVIADHPSGIEVLRGDTNLQFIDAPLEPGQMTELMEGILKSWEGYVVINTGNNLDRWTVEILDVVDTILLVTTPQLPALRAIRNFLELAEARVEESDKWQLVMNGYQSQKVTQIKNVEESIQFPVSLTVTHDPELVSTSINRGSPLLLSHGNSAVARDIITLARRLSSASHLSSETPSMKDAPPPPPGKEEKGKRFSVRQFFTGTILRMERSAGKA